MGLQKEEGMSTGKPRCRGCGLSPDQIEEYVDTASEDDMCPNEWAIENEGTYNPATGMFWCTECYINRGQPLGVA